MTFQKAQGLNQLWYKYTSSTAAKVDNDGFALRRAYLIQSPTVKGTFSFRITLMHIFGLNNNNNWDDLYSAVRMGIIKNKGAVTYKLIVIRLSKQKGLEICFKAVYCR